MDTAQLNNSIGGKSRSSLGAGGEWCTYQLFLSLVRGIALFLTKKHRWANTWNICLILVDNQVTAGHSREHGASRSPCSTSARRSKRCLDSARLRRTAAQPPWCSNPKDFKITGGFGSSLSHFWSERMAEPQLGRQHRHPAVQTTLREQSPPHIPHQ